MEDANIYIKNGMGSGRGTVAQKKISSKGSIDRNKNTMALTSKVKSISRGLGGVAGDIGKGSSTSVMKGISKSGTVGAIIGGLLTLANKGYGLYINYNEAQTGDKLRAQNSRATLNTITTGGMNYVYGAIQNELFTKQTISRQNFANDYGRELYQINVEGYKNKRI